MTTATPMPCVVRDIDGNLYGPFPDTMAAAEWLAGFEWAASGEWPIPIQVLNDPASMKPRGAADRRG